MPTAPDFFFKSTALFGMSILVGLTVYLLGASAIGWISPIWWGGSVLLFPVIFGVAFAVIGAMPLYMIVEKLIHGLGGMCSLRDTCAVGTIVGFDDGFAGLVAPQGLDHLDVVAVR